MPTRVQRISRHVADERLDQGRFMCSSAYILINLSASLIVSLISNYFQTRETFYRTTQISPRKLSSLPAPLNHVAKPQQPGQLTGTNRTNGQRGSQVDFFFFFVGLDSSAMWLQVFGPSQSYHAVSHRPSYNP